MTHHIMLDLETLGTHATAPIVSVGLVVFDPDTFTIGESRHWAFNLDDQFASGRLPSADTISWWLDRPRDAQLALTKQIRLGASYKDLGHYLFPLVADFIHDQLDPSGCIWGYGSDFDVALLGSLFDQRGIKRPWGYKQVACYRTLARLFHHDEDTVLPTIEHDAHEDARAQALTLMKTARRAGITL